MEPTARFELATGGLRRAMMIFFQLSSYRRQLFPVHWVDRGCVLLWCVMTRFGILIVGKMSARKSVAIARIIKSRPKGLSHWSYCANGGKFNFSHSFQYPDKRTTVPKPGPHVQLNPNFYWRGLQKDYPSDTNSNTCLPTKVDSSICFTGQSNKLSTAHHCVLAKCPLVWTTL